MLKAIKRNIWETITKHNQPTPISTPIKPENKSHKHLTNCNLSGKILSNNYLLFYACLYYHKA
ncbi:hypothetical protein BLOT_012736 [Blomia tropicalis]|nr:hypothetical protein BLOT_012736 [Blomia tropicalis]